MSAEHDPIARFQSVYERALREDPGDATRVALATADASGAPSVRMVLLKRVDERGFVFYTNYGSRKAADLEENARAALCFYWESIREQVRVAGPTERLDPGESDAYFATRSRGSQLAAWASRQSDELPSRARLVARYLRLKARFAGRPIPRPDFWGGYLLRPERIEFWTNRPFRLHDRAEFVRTDDGWERRRLYP